jgi:DNA-binding transcriptional LysR family regulator
MQSRKRVSNPDIAPVGLIHLRYIEMFQAILQMGTLTDAAALLNISQPAATKLLKQAERRLGFPLFVRVKGQWHLTPESQLLKGQIGRIFDELRDLQRLISNIARAEKQLLRVVSTPTLANAIIPKSITKLRHQLGQTGVELSTQHSREMLKSIALREADIGFTLQPLDHPDIRCEALCEGPLALIAPVGTWSRGEAFLPIDINSLADSPLVSITKADSLGRKLEAHLEQLSPPARISIRVQTYQIAKDLVCSGEGLALIDPFTAVSAGPEVQIRVVEPVMPIDLYAVYRVDGPLNRVQKSFIQCVKNVASESISFLTSYSTPPVAHAVR